MFDTVVELRKVEKSSEVEFIENKFINDSTPQFGISLKGYRSYLGNGCR